MNSLTLGICVIFITLITNAVSCYICWNNTVSSKMKATKLSNAFPCNCVHCYKKRMQRRRSWCLQADARAKSAWKRRAHKRINEWIKFILRNFKISTYILYTVVVSSLSPTPGGRACLSFSQGLGPSLSLTPRLSLSLNVLNRSRRGVQTVGFEKSSFPQKPHHFASRFNLIQVH